MPATYSVEELAREANRWCSKHRVTPASGQAGAAPSNRTIRYYRTLGLIDPPADGAYGEEAPAPAYCPALRGQSPTPFTFEETPMKPKILTIDRNEAAES